MRRRTGFISAKGLAEEVSGPGADGRAPKPLFWCVEGPGLCRRTRFPLLTSRCAEGAWASAHLRRGRIEVGTRPRARSRHKKDGPTVTNIILLKFKSP